MRVLFVAVLTWTALAAARTVPAAAQAAASNAYVDASARELVRLARARRVTTDRRIEAYRTTAVERISVGLRAGIADKLLYRRETASRIDWRRDGPVNIEVLGAREVMPPVSGRPQVPFDLAHFMPHLAFDPVDSEMLLRFDTTVIRHPLAAGSEAHYRFATGDSTVIRLPDGRTVRLRELRILPRRRDPHLINGSFWLDLESHAVVQAYFRLARDVRSDGGDAPPFLRPAGAELDYIAIDYGLWELRWWLPRTVAARGVMHAGRIHLPLSYERRYQDYDVTGDTLATVPVVGEAPTMETRPCRPPLRFTIAISTGDAERDTTSARFRRMRARQAARDSARAARRREAGAQPDSARICDRQFTVTTAAADELLRSPLLAPDIYEGDADILSEDELRAIADRVRQIPEPPWRLERPVLEWGLRGPGLVRYNRVEGLSVGARALLDLGPARADGELRFGTASRELSGELGLTRSGDRFQLRAAAYHRLDHADIAVQPLSFGASLSALLVGHDDVDYFRATGVELRIAPPATRSQWYDLRLFAERQRAVEKHTDFSLPHLADDDRVFRDNRAATPAEQIGAVLRLRAAHGVDPRAPRVAGELELHGEAGDYALLRPRALVRGSVPVTRMLTLGLEAETGTTLGDTTVQRLWQIGGVSTVRGYRGAAAIGDSFWRGRAELGAGLPLVRLTLFGDVGWAGLRDVATSGRPIRSVGVGASFLDGLIRLDLARALDQRRGWKLHVQAGGL